MLQPTKVHALIFSASESFITVISADDTVGSRICTPKHFLVEIHDRQYIFLLNYS